MKLLVVLSGLLMGSSLLAQNLVPNNSFELNSGCPVGPGEITTATGWSNPDTATADYFNACNTAIFPMPSLSVPSNIMGYQPARTGSGYAGIISNAVVNFPPLPAIVDDYREYIQVGLTAPLVAGTDYEVEFYWNLSNNSTHYVEELGVYFSNTITNLQQSNSLSFTPQLSLSGTPLNDTVNWVHFSQTYTAVGGEQYIIIGNFNDPANTTSGTTGVASNLAAGGDFAYYYIEDVSVKEATCFEIESILVDACGTPEGQNEMVTFRVGSQDLNVADLNVNWPSNSFAGIVQNSTTAQQVTAVNNTITGCGYLIEPTGGILPAGSEVLLITSYNFNPTANSFANLNDTLIVIFQDAIISAGHFGNYNASGGTRTLSMSFTNPTGCSDIVSYERDLLLNQNLTYGGGSAIKNGAFVEFSPDGTATYNNLGCLAPAGLLSIDISGDLSAVCGGETINLTATVNGMYNEIVWSTSEGTFSQNNSLSTVLTVNNTVSSSFYIYGGVVSNCNDTIMDSIQIAIANVPNVTISASNDTVCSGSTVTLTANGGVSYVWNTGSTTNPITVSAGGQYIVTGTSSCGSNSDTVTITLMNAPSDIIADGLVCSPNEEHNITVASCAGCSYIWSDGTVGTSITTTSQSFSVATTNFCGTGTTSYSYVDASINASIGIVDSVGCAAFTPTITNTSTGDISNSQSTWNFGIGTSTTPHITYNAPGNYLIQLIVSNIACSDTAYQNIEVQGCTYPPITPPLYTEVIIPNIFTPNGDNENDQFHIQTINAKNLTGTIYNRWGNELYNLNGLDATWDGGNSNEGTYFYILEVTFLDDTKKEYSGSFMLIR